jgi:hypothetical protein
MFSTCFNVYVTRKVNIFGSAPPSLHPLLPQQQQQQQQRRQRRRRRRQLMFERKIYQ